MIALNENLLVLDCEASGLSDESYPISIGVSGPDLQGWYWMISPMEDWDYWDDMSQMMHDIDRSTLMEQGRDPFLVARELNAVFKGKKLLVDSQWDQFWVNKLFDCLDVRKSFELVTIESVLTKQEYEVYCQWVESTNLMHQALNDATIIRDRLAHLVQCRI